ncbi:RluA family pseudouridine synthase [uncultured Helicobacter sp.]|uniref:pseudouridine synthase family protein n=1 Tax=uncultured Helicobacter sp. TaxID=175537 RepID=UPI00262ADC8F|nr:RluA family pseudouridine synthase [uncultured Helicobacter sp.]
MPFVTRCYKIEEPIAAFLFLMRHRRYSIKEAQRAIDKAYLTQNGHIIRKNEIICGDVELNEFIPQDMPLEPLFYNTDFCVYDKPHNLLTHPKGRFYHYSLNDALKSRFGTHAKALHRLDKETSGLLLCTINPQSERALKVLMQKGAVIKSYYAIVKGKVEKEILIDEPLSTQRHKGGDLCIKSIVCENGKKSRTLLRPIAYHNPTNSSLVSALALTGRTHQIRVHCAFIGHRILGDPLYGANEAHSREYLQNNELPQYTQYFGAPYLCLNAHNLQFHFKGQDYTFTSHFCFDFMPHFAAYFKP